MTFVFTICSNNYLAQAINLGDSLMLHNPEYIFKIGLVDKKIPQIDYVAIPFEIVEVESIGITLFDEMFKRYNIIELNTAVKPFYFKYFFNSIPEVDKVIYLDPDIYVYSLFFELDQTLLENEIVITPHFTTPINDDKFQAENDFLNSGLYNLGFIALRRGSESSKFLAWWANRMETKCYIRFSDGMFTDQIWINFVPLYFKKVYILSLPGYNVAYWNMHERIITENLQVLFAGNQTPLVFFHFSGYDPLKPNILSKYQDRFNFESRPDVEKLFNDYASLLKLNNHKIYSHIVCYYVTVKEILDSDEANRKARLIPFYKRAIRKICLSIIRKLKINVEYYIQ